MVDVMKYGMVKIYVLSGAARWLCGVVEGQCFKIFFVFIELPFDFVPLRSGRRIK